MKKKPVSNVPIYILLALVGFIPYIFTLSYGYVVCDDHELVFRYTSEIDSLADIPDAMFKAYLKTDYYRPMMNLSFILNYAIGGKNPAYYHLVNVILHSMFSVFLFILFLKLDIRREIAIFFAMLFASLPILVNAVAWIVGRNDILYSLFGIISFIYLINYSKENRIKDFIIHIAFLLLAFLSKETAMLVPAIFFVYLITYAKKKTSGKTWIALTASWAGAGATWLLMREMSVLGNNINQSGIEVFISNLALIPEFFAKYFLPVKLSVLPTYNAFNTIAGLIIIVALATYIIYYKKYGKKLLFPLIWILILLIPGMYVTLQNSNLWNEYLECRFYLPAAGMTLLLILIIPQKVENFIATKKPVLFILLLALVIITGTAAKKYREPVAFYENAIENDPKRPLFYHTLMNYLLTRGDFVHAEAVILKSIKVNPDYIGSYYALGRLYFDYGDYQRAVEYMNETIRRDSNMTKAYFSLSVFYLKMNRFDDAVKINSTAWQRERDNKNLLFMLISTYMAKGDIPNVLKYSEIYLKIKKADPGVDKKLSNKLLQFAKDSCKDSLKVEAGNCFELAAKIDKNNPEAARLAKKYQ